MPFDEAWTRQSAIPPNRPLSSFIPPGFRPLSTTHAGVPGFLRRGFSFAHMNTIDFSRCVPLLADPPPRVRPSFVAPPFGVSLPIFPTDLYTCSTLFSAVARARRTARFFPPLIRVRPVETRIPAFLSFFFFLFETCARVSSVQPRTHSARMVSFGVARGSPR